MPQHNFRGLRGELSYIEIDSACLRNQVQDPTARQVAIYRPAEALADATELPLFVALAPFTGSGLKLTAWQSFSESLPQRLDRLIEEGQMGPVLLAMPDAFTSLGGNQYIDTPALGNWSTWLRTDLLEAIEPRFNAGGAPSRRALFGRSSGGYGALVNGMLAPNVWGAVACHSGDADFDLLYRSELPKAVAALAAFDGDARRFVEHLRAQPSIGGREFYALMMLAMAASYDPHPTASLGARLPVDLHTCALDAAAWSRWLRWDPLRLLDEPAHVDALRTLRGLFIDCGSKDEYHLHFGNRQLAARLAEANVPHTYEEFPGGHSGVDYRLDRSLPALFRALMG